MARFPFLIVAVLVSWTLSRSQPASGADGVAENRGEVTDVAWGPPIVVKVRFGGPVNLVPWQRLSLYRPGEKEDVYLGPIFVRQVRGDLVVATCSGLRPGAGDIVRETPPLNAYGVPEGAFLDEVRDIDRLGAVIQAVQEQRISIPYAILQKEEAIRKIKSSRLAIEIGRAEDKLHKAEEDLKTARAEEARTLATLKTAEAARDLAANKILEAEGKMTELRRETAEAEKAHGDAVNATKEAETLLATKRTELDKYKAALEEMDPGKRAEAILKYVSGDTKDLPKK